MSKKNAIKEDQESIRENLEVCIHAKTDFEIIYSCDSAEAFIEG